MVTDLSEADLIDENADSDSATVIVITWLRMRTSSNNVNRV